MSFYQILTLVIVFQAFLSGAFFYKYLNKMLRVVFVIVCLAVFSEFSSQIIIHIFKATTLWVTHFYVMIEFFLWAVFYWLLMKSFINRNLYWSVVVLFELYCILNTVFIQELSEYAQTRSVEGILLVLLPIAAFYKTMIESKIDKLIKDPIIWINTAVLLYFSSSIFFHSLFNVFLNNNIEFLKISGYLFIGANTVFYLLLSVSFYLQKLKSVRE